MRQERERLIQQGALGGLPTQVNLMAVSVSNSNDVSEDEGSSQEDGGRKRSSDEDTGDESPSHKRRDVRDGEEVEGVVGGITKLVEFCSKDIK